MDTDWILAWRLQEAHDDLSDYDMASLWEEMRRHGHVRLHHAWASAFANAAQELQERGMSEGSLEQIACEIERDYAPVTKLHKQEKKDAYEAIAFLDENYAELASLEDILDIFQDNALLGATLQDAILSIRNHMLCAPRRVGAESVKGIAAAIYDEKYPDCSNEFAALAIAMLPLPPEAYNPLIPSFNELGEADLLRQSYGIVIHDVYDMPCPDNDQRFVVMGTGAECGQFHGDVFVREEISLLDRLIKDSFLFGKREIPVWKT